MLASLLHVTSCPSLRRNWNSAFGVAPDCFIFGDNPYRIVSGWGVIGSDIESAVPNFGAVHLPAGQLNSLTTASSNEFMRILILELRLMLLYIWG